MARTLNEVIGYLDGLVGSVPPDLSNRSLDGQCVALIKNLLSFLGAPNPYAARGNARDVANAYVNQGIASPSDGRLRVCVNPSMGGGYGHVWVDINGIANYESNGARALHATKNTRPINQARQIVNLDKWLISEPAPAPKPGTGLPQGFVWQRGTFYGNGGNRIRRDPDTSNPGNIVPFTWKAGAAQETDACGTANGYFWRSWIGGSGNRNYVATANASRTEGFGTFTPK